MKKISLLILIATLILACNAVSSRFVPISTELPSKTPSVFYLPVLPKITPSPTTTPIIATETPTPVVNKPTINQFYTVQAGDTLGGIAQKFGVPLDYLTSQNGITNPDFIFPGEVVAIPIWPPQEIKKVEADITIVVSLTNQSLDFYENGVLVRTMLVSTGTYLHPTPPGIWKICAKLVSTTMTDRKTYYLTHVPWVMYICNADHDLGDGYSLHGTYWHHNFGHPMSHGCVNLSIPDAKWIYDRVEIGQEIEIVP